MSIIMLGLGLVSSCLEPTVSPAATVPFIGSARSPLISSAVHGLFSLSFTKLSRKIHSKRLAWISHSLEKTHFNRCPHRLYFLLLFLAENWMHLSMTLLCWTTWQAEMRAASLWLSGVVIFLLPQATALLSRKMLVGRDLWTLPFCSCLEMVRNAISYFISHLSNAAKIMQ